MLWNPDTGQPFSGPHPTPTWWASVWVGYPAKERTRAGLAAANGRKGGRPRKIDGAQAARRVDFLDCAETPIRPLIGSLGFIEDPQRWGFKFRFGVFRIDEHDFETLRSAMTGPLAA